MTDTTPLPKPFYPHRPINGGDPNILGFGYGFDPMSWDVEPKLDGCRVIVHLPTGAVFSRHGSQFSRADLLQKAVSKLQNRLAPWKDKLGSDGNPLFEWVDCEALVGKGHDNGKGSLVVIDVVANGDLTARAEYFHHIKPFPLTGAALPDALYRMPRTPLRKGKALWNRLIKVGSLFEGIVLKRRNSQYAMNWTNPAKESSSWVKQRFPR